MQILTPFIINHIYKNYDKVVYNGALKKNMYIMVINALYKNPKVNLEYQVKDFNLNLKQKHLLIKILDNFLTSPKISLTENRDEIFLRENAAKMLSKIIMTNDDLKYTNLKPHIFDLLCKKLITLIDNFRERNYPIIFGILKVI